MSDRELRPFVHLHTHSHYSLLQALPQISDLVKAAKKDGQKAIALTDAGNLYGAIEFYKSCEKNDIKPLIGVDAFVAPRTRFDKEHRTDNKTARLILIAENIQGYKNLIQLVTRSNLEGFYYNPRVDRELLTEYKDGLIAILPSFASEISRAFDDIDDTKIREAIDWYKQLYGEKLYMEITRHHEIPNHEAKMQRLIQIARAHAIPLVAAHDVYYMKPDDAMARELVIKIKNGGTLDRDTERSEDFSFITQEQANELFADIPEALDNTVKIADMVDVKLNLGTWVFPNFPIPEGRTYDAELRDFAYRGFEMRNVPKTPEALERIDYELSVIAKKGYSPYFLVVSDLLTHASSVGILTNTRGSAAGSFVSYLTGITTVNPLEYQLPFERFLNPERPSPPDIDMDIADNRRDDLIDYARSKYGIDHVAQIGTFGTMLARAAVRDVARALGHSYAIGDKIAKLIPQPKQGFPVTIESALNETPELKQLYDADPEVREVLDLAQKIEGNARHIGVHAAGVVMSPTPVTDFVPLQNDPKGGKTITQYDMHAVEDAGLLKFDFLGLKNLAVLADAVARVKNRLDVSVDIANVPLDDKKTFEMLARGETLGTFQLAGDGMTSHLVNLKPSNINDINAMVALYRPGPMAFIPEYIERKHDPSKISYLDPRMKDILEKSYGVITYQDDVLMIAINLAGYSWLDADKFRKAIGKKIPEEMAAQKEKFQKGCLEHGMKPAVVKALWEQIETFAAYGFNKAHAASYGNLAYKTAYMKANFPVDYMAALLTADAGDVEKIGEIVGEAKRMGLAVLPPDVNESDGTFTVLDEKTIRFGLFSIKNFGEGIGTTIFTERKAGGKFKSLADFLSRIKDKNLNKKSLESLIQAGALDNLDNNCERGLLLANIEHLLAYQREHMSQAVDQGNLFGMFGAPTEPPPLRLEKAPPMPAKEKLAYEKELLGLYISGHPLDQHREKLSKQKFKLAQINEHVKPDTIAVVAGCVETVREMLTKKGDKMAFVTIADLSGALEVVVFPRTLTETSRYFIPGNCILVKGKLSPRNGETSFIAEGVMSL